MGVNFDGEDKPAERPTDQEIKDTQTSEIEQEREDRNARLGIGNHTGDKPQHKSEPGGNLPASVGQEPSKDEE